MPINPAPRRRRVPAAAASGSGMVGTACGPRRPSAEQLLAQARAVIEPAHRSVVAVLPSRIGRIIGYHSGWWDAEGRPVATAGKALRPALAMICARAAGGRDEQWAEAAVDAAVAVEMVHDFSLLHDDVMDGDLTRRHRPTAWAVFGTGEAILAGDVLLVSAIERLAGFPNPSEGWTAVQVLAAAVQELCAGQAADLAFESRDQVSLAECQEMAEGKTGALLGAACQLGAMAGGADARTATCYRRFGRLLGSAFQLVDDLLGIWGDPRVTGKPAGSDLVSHKKTLPVVAALTSGTRAGEQLAQLYRSDEELDPAAVAQAVRLIEAAGARTWAAAQAQAHVDAALAELRMAAPTPDGALDLETLAALITSRRY